MWKWGGRGGRTEADLSVSNNNNNDNNGRNIVPRGSSPDAKQTNKQALGHSPAIGQMHIRNTQKSVRTLEKNQQIK